MNDQSLVAGAARPTRHPVSDLREWLDILARTDRLALIRPSVDLEFELAAIAGAYDGQRATLFPRPNGHAIPVVSGLTSSRDWMAEAMGVEPHELLARFLDSVRHPLPCPPVETGPVQEIVHRDVDLRRLLPAPTHNARDGGPYLSAALLICNDIETGARNVSINRCQITGPNRLGVAIDSRDTGAFYAKAEKAGRDLEIALVVGIDPLTLLASQAIAPMGQDELEIAGALHRKAMPVVKCLTNGVLVPAHAEIVLEGRVLARLREPEGPFGEYTQYYGRQADRFVIEVDAVTHRSSPIFHTITGGGLEHLLLGAVPREATILALLRASFPNVLNVHLPFGGVGRYHLHVQIRKDHEAIARNVILGALATHPDVKQVVVVDEDVDIFDPRDVEWAVATRFQADQDLIVIPRCKSSRLDPSALGGTGAKMGLDATKLLGAEPVAYERIAVPGRDRVVAGDALGAVPAAEWRTILTGT